MIVASKITVTCKCKRFARDAILIERMLLESVILNAPAGGGVGGCGFQQDPEEGGEKAR